MSILLTILPFLVIFVLIIYFVNRRNLLNRSQLQKQIHDLETQLSTTKLDLDKNIKVLRELHESNQFENYAGHIVSQMNQGVVYIDQNRVIRLVNTYAGQFFDVSPMGNPYQKSLRVLLNGKEDYSLFEAAFNGKSQIIPDKFEIVNQRGKTPIIGSVIPLNNNGSDDTVVFIFADNSQNVAQINEEKAFFSSAAHELRTPLTVIRMTVSLLLQHFNDLSQEKIIEHLKRTDESADRLVKLVNDFLNVSRLEQNRIEVNIKPFDIIKLTDEVIEEINPLAKERKLTIKHELADTENRMVIGDSAKSKEVLINLISNGIKYTIQGEITITHHVETNSLQTKVTDTGNGIPQEFQPMLFKKFSQVGNARLQTSTVSTGLGLYISKKLAQLMRGDVYLETSEPGKGSTFTFKLPLG